MNTLHYTLTITKESRYIIMDHTLDVIIQDMQYDINNLKAEYQKHKSLKECPSYQVVNTYIRSANIFRKALGYELLTIKKLIED